MLGELSAFRNGDLGGTITSGAVKTTGMNESWSNLSCTFAYTVFAFLQLTMAGEKFKTLRTDLILNS